MNTTPTDPQFRPAPDIRPGGPPGGASGMQEAGRDAGTTPAAAPPATAATTESADPRALPLSGPVAYLTGQYPRATDTFILREVAMLRARGIAVQTCSVRATDPSHHIGAEQREAHATTFRVQPAAKNPATLLAAHFRLLRAAPKRWVSALGLAFSTLPPGMKALLWQIFYFLEAGVLADRLKRDGVVHLHNHFGDSSCSVAMLTAELAAIPYSYTMHGPGEFFEPMYWRIDAKIARAAFVACISHYARAQGMIFAGQQHWDRMRIVHCGVEPARYGPAGHESAPRAADAPPHLLFVGRLAAIKGVALLLDAFAALRADHPGARLSLVGDGPERAALEARARALTLGDSVHFAGYRSQDDVADLLGQADIFVLPSFAEGVPVVLMEAMAAGVPVIASRVAGIPELVADGVSGFLTPPGDVEALEARLRDLLADPEMRARMGAAGRAKVEAEYDVAKEAAWLHALLAGSLAGQLPPGLRP